MPENMSLESDASKPAAPVHFFFEKEHVVRIVPRASGDLWFVAADACRVLGLKQAAPAVQSLDGDEKGVTTIHTLGGPQRVLTVSESGLYALIFRSRKPKAIAFRKWVTGEVLPTLRRAGNYTLPKAEPMASLADRKALTAVLNAGTNLAAEIRRSAGPRTAAMALPAICDKIGIPIDLTVSSTLAQEEFSFSGADSEIH